MDYIIIGLLILNLVLVVMSLLKNINESNITERRGKLELAMMKEMGSLSIEEKKVFGAAINAVKMHRCTDFFKYFF